MGEDLRDHRPAGSLNNVVLAPLAQPHAGYRTADLVPVAKLGTTDMLVIASPQLGKRRLGDLRSDAFNADGQPLSVGHPGTETAQFLSLPAIERQLGFAFVHVPYKGAGPMVNDVLGGHLDLAIVNAPSVRKLVNEGRLVELAHVEPWLRQRGEPVVSGWAGWFVARATPEPLRRWLGRTLRAAMDEPDVRTALR